MATPSPSFLTKKAHVLSSGTALVDSSRSKSAEVLSLCLLTPVMSSFDRQRRLIECKQYSLEEICVWQEPASGQATPGALLESSSGTNSPSNDLELGIAPQGQGARHRALQSSPRQGWWGRAQQGLFQGWQSFKGFLLSVCSSRERPLHFIKLQLPLLSGAQLPLHFVKLQLPLHMSTCNCPCTQQAATAFALRFAIALAPPQPENALALHQAAIALAPRHATALALH